MKERNSASSNCARSTARSATGLRFDEGGVQVPPPSDAKTVIAVWVGLYPTVMLIALTFSPIGLPVWLDRLITNLLGSAIMTFFTMPFYVNPSLKRWLHPAPD